MTDAIKVPLMRVSHVSKTFGHVSDGVLDPWLQKLRLTRPSALTRAVDDVSLDIAKGEVVGLVGESGCGKSTLGRMVAGIMEPTAGQVLVNGQDLKTLPRHEAEAARLKIQMIFQDPYASLNPRMRVRDIVGESPRLHNMVSARDLDRYVSEQLERAGLSASLRNRFPHQFSGGQRQRIGIARALAVAPDMLVCDEAVAALDVSIQAQILNLFMQLRAQLGLTYLFISHDLGVVEHLSDRVVIMYLGRIVEQAPVAEIFSRPNHPYTQALLAEIPKMRDRKKVFSIIKGEIPSPLNPPAGCHFHPRCPHAMPRCRAEVPLLKAVAGGHLSACHLNDQT
ncbi:MAG TPA: oligopeptide/dipeptide ABC transporter ATP-binding protein [Advenella sp.]|nr:oligopeptide/dipeptide ABC transporter ATP-binding protein [Advenella sp.]